MLSPSPWRRRVSTVFKFSKVCTVFFLIIKGTAFIFDLHLPQGKTFQ